MEYDRLGFDFTVLNVDLISSKDDRNVLAHPDKVPVPVRNILVRDLRSYVEHDDSALSLDIVSVSQPSELLLTSGIPHVEPDGATVCVEI